MPVADNITDLRADLTAGVDLRWAERIGLFFLKGGAVDPDRANVEINAVLRVGNERSVGPTGGLAQSWGMRIAANKAEMHIARDGYNGPAIRKGDKVRAVERLGQPFWEVAFVNDRHASRLILSLTEV